MPPAEFGGCGRLSGYVASSGMAFRFILPPLSARRVGLPVPQSPAPGPSDLQGLATVSEQEDRSFFDTFMMVLAFLVLFTVAMFVLANMISKQTIGERHLSTPAAQQQLAERLEPEGQLCVEGAEAECEVQVATAAESAPAEDEAQSTGGEMTGEQVYSQSCSACHAQGVAGAPQTGDQAAWESRMAKGRETLLDHAINGYQGDAGFMPAKGGNPGLSDDEVAAALDYMVDELE